jgi:hypothetical protein
MDVSVLVTASVTNRECLTVVPALGISPVMFAPSAPTVAGLVWSGGGDAVAV